MDRLIKIDGSNQVVVRVEPGQRCSGVLTLCNVMHTMPVAFRLLPLCRTRFTIRPQTGIIAPLGTIKVEITYLPPPPPAPILPNHVPESDDSFFLDSVVCAGACATSKDGSVPNDWFSNKKKQVFTDSGLHIFYVGSAVLARLVEEGNMEKIRKVLECSDPQWRAADSADAQGRTLLHLAIARGRADLVQLLLECGADVEATSHRAGRSPLEAAAAAGETLIGELLLARGASTARSPKSDFGPLHYAAAGGHAELLRLLLLKGEAADAATADGRTALHLAASEQRQECAGVLMAAGARVDAPGPDGNTPLHAAAAAGDEAMARMLIAEGCAGIREARNRAGKTAYDVAAEGGPRRLFDLLRSGEKLMAAARKGDVRALIREIEIGAALDGRDGSGWTPLMMAAFKGRVEVIRVLLEKGAQIDGRDEEGYTALHCAAEGGQAEAAELLLKRGADLEARTAKGRTAVEIAGELGYAGIVRILVQGGAAGSREPVVKAVVEALPLPLRPVAKAGKGRVGAEKEKEMGGKRKGSRAVAAGRGTRTGFRDRAAAAAAVAVASY
ncbi:hypothetical protein KSP39_PZI002890 [Platanthera zijinensis]|uniref:MSP domain-containing protein n=1 Tax=Platanthera zijinensis TaxID=2320716 RepID=A0AAP0C0Q9_9ASPA